MPQLHLQEMTLLDAILLSQHFAAELGKKEYNKDLTTQVADIFEYLYSLEDFTEN